MQQNRVYYYQSPLYYAIGIICVNILLNWPHIKEDKQNKVHGKAENVSYGRLNVELFIVHAAALSSSVALFCFISRIIESPNDLQYHNGFTILLKFPNLEFFNWRYSFFYKINSKNHDSLVLKLSWFIKRVLWFKKYVTGNITTIYVESKILG